MGPPLVPYQPFASAHLTCLGPEDMRPSAMDILEQAGMLGKMIDKTILITGGSSGLGASTAAAMYETGARLFITARNMSKLNEVIDNIVNKSPSKAKDFPRPEAVEMYLEELRSVRKAAHEIKAKTETLNVLINNAGVAFIPYSKSVDGFELHMATNHFSHFLLFQELKTLLAAGAQATGSTSRVVNVSSSAHRRSTVHLNDINFDVREYDKISGYGQSKTANIWMANSITRRYASMAITGLSVHPGVIPTELDRHMSNEEIEGLRARMGPHMKSLEQGAATTVWAVVSPQFEDVKEGGRYLTDVGEAGPMEETTAQNGYASHAYDEEGEEALWQLSCKAVGVLDG